MDPFGLKLRSMNPLARVCRVIESPQDKFFRKCVDSIMKLDQKSKKKVGETSPQGRDAGSGAQRGVGDDAGRSADSDAGSGASGGTGGGAGNGEGSGARGGAGSSAGSPPGSKAGSDAGSGVTAPTEARDEGSSGGLLTFGLVS